MTTPQNLLMISMDVAPERPIHPADLSVALAGAELVDLLEAQTISLDKDCIVPGWLPVPHDRFLWEAALSLEFAEPYRVSDWLTSRGDTLAAAYTAALEADGLAIWKRPKGHPFRRRELVLVDSPARRQTLERWSSAEPVLATLAGFMGIRPEGQQDSPYAPQGAEETILSAIREVLVEQEAERTERIIAEAQLHATMEKYSF